MPKIEKIMRLDLPLEPEIIVVDDGSSDRTGEILLGRHETLRLYQTPVNVGKGAAVRIGLTLATGDVILLQDADLELDPNEYSKLLAPILSGAAQVVYGSRFLKNNNRVPAARRLANFGLTFFTNILYHTKLTDMETAYKIFTAEVAAKLKLKANRFEIEPELTAQISRAGYRIVEVPVSYRPRTKSEGKKINWRDGVKAVWMLIKCRFDKLSSG